MKNPEDYFKKYNIDEQIISNKNALISSWLSDFVRLVQIDAYNEAIVRASENADIDIPDGAWMGDYVNPGRISINKQSILKLLKK